MELIVAVDRLWAIGREGKLLFSIPEDLKHFKDLTLGRAIVYGRKTMATFPGGRPLPGRKNYILTHSPASLPPDAIGVTSAASLLEAAAEEDRLFVVGGESVYRALLPYCARAWVTQVDAEAGGDRHCPELDKASDWFLAERSEWKEWRGLRFRFCRYDNKRFC